MANLNLVPVNGVVQNVAPFGNDCCQYLISINSDGQPINFVISSDTWVVEETMLTQGMNVTAFYDANIPIPLIYPPQYRAVIITAREAEEHVVAGYFNQDLLSADGSLRLNLGPQTQIVSSLGQSFTCSITERLILVYYSVTTRSIPPQTTPRKIIVLC